MKWIIVKKAPNELYPTRAGWYGEFDSREEANAAITEIDRKYDYFPMRESDFLQSRN